MRFQEETRDQVLVRFACAAFQRHGVHFEWERDAWLVELPTGWVVCNTPTELFKASETLH